MFEFLVTLGQSASVLLILYGGYLVLEEVGVLGSREVSSEEELKVLEEHLLHE